MPALGNDALGGPSLLAANGEYPTSHVEQFHPPTSAAEDALDVLITLAHRDSNLGWFATGQDERDKSQDQRFAPYFSKNLHKAWIDAEADAVKKNCGGRYIEGDMCGIDIHPIICAQDINESGLVYRTEQADSETATISYRWPQDPKIIATYRMTHTASGWILDGVSCAGYLKFNMK